MQMRVDRCSDIMKNGGPQSKEFWRQLKGVKPINKIRSIKIPGTSQTTSDQEVIKTSIMMYYNTLGKMNHNLCDNDENDMYITSYANDTSGMNNQDFNYNNRIDNLSFSIEDVIDSISHCKITKPLELTRSLTSLSKTAAMLSFHHSSVFSKDCQFLNAFQTNGIMA